MEAGILRNGVLGIETDVLYQRWDLVPAYEVRLTPISNVYYAHIEAVSADYVTKIQGRKMQWISNVHLADIEVDAIHEDSFQNANVNQTVFKGDWQSLALPVPDARLRSSCNLFIKVCHPCIMAVSLENEDGKGTNMKRQRNVYRRTFPLLLGLFALAACSTPASELHRELLWPNGAPGARGSDPEKDMPAITIYQPDKGNGTAVVVCPGGGYGHLAMGHEGRDIAEWFNSIGITAVVLEYRMARGGYRHPIPLMDAQRAVRTVRCRAKELGVDPSRIGIMGFSAGGHLASTAGTHFDAGNPDADDPIERVGCRPDFLILCYPVIAFGEPYTHKGSQKNLIGENPSEELVRSLSNEKQVARDTPPTFLFATDEDGAVPAENSVMFYLALHRAGVPAELHVYQKGGHGLGLAQKIEGTNRWPDDCRLWLQGLGMLEARK